MCLKNFKNGYEVSDKSEIAKKEKNDCVVRALANAFEINYNMAHVFVSKRFDRKKGKGTNGFNHILKGLSKKSINFKPSGQLNLFEQDNKSFNIEHIGDQPKLGGNLINRKYRHKKVAYTVKAFAQKFNKGTYIILVHKHAFTIKDGVLIDNGSYQFNGYRRVVESAFKVQK